MAAAVQIEFFVPSCVVCRSPVPPERAQGRSRDTCSETCAAIWKLYQEHVLANSRCPRCYHPSTPEERRDFHLWRIERGDLHERRGRPRLTFADRVRHAIEQAIPVLRGVVDGIVDINHLASLAAEFEKLLDAKEKP